MLIARIGISILVLILVGACRSLPETLDGKEVEAFELQVALTCDPDFGFFISTRLTNHTDEMFSLEYFASPAAYFARGLRLVAISGGRKLPLGEPIHATNAQLEILSGESLDQKVFLPFFAEDADEESAQVNLRWSYSIDYFGRDFSWAGEIPFDFSQCEPL